MLTVSSFRQGDKFLTSLGFNGYGFAPCFCLNQPRHRTRIGIPPYTYGSNKIGDHACLHKNLKGAISILPLGLPHRVTVQKEYEDFSMSTYFSYSRDEYQMNSYWFTDFLFIGDSVPFEFRWTSYTKTTYPVKKYRRKYWSGLRWKGLVGYLDLFMEQWTEAGSLYRTSLYSTCVEFDASRTKYRMGQTAIDPVNKYDKTYFAPVIWSYTGWISISSSLTYSLVSDHSVDPESFVTATTLWSRYELITQGLRDTPNNLMWEQLAQTAAGNTRALDINTPMYYADFFRMKETILSLIGPLKALSEGKPPTWEDLRRSSLSFIYGVKLTFLDTQEILKGLTRRIPTLMDGTTQVAHSRDSEAHAFVGHGLGSYSGVIERNFNLKFYYSPFDEEVLRQINNAYVLDVMPSLENTWDLVPFSFVVDWFVNVGEVLSSIDSNTYISTLRIKGVVMTQRTNISIPISCLIQGEGRGTVVGKVMFVDYHRRLRPTLPKPYSRLGLSNPFTHWVEGGLLFIRKQR